MKTEKTEPKRTVPAENFMMTVEANVDNEKLSDVDFRQFIRNSLPGVIYEDIDTYKKRTQQNK